MHFFNDYTYGFCFTPHFLLSSIFVQKRLSYTKIQNNSKMVVVLSTPTLPVKCAKLLVTVCLFHSDLKIFFALKDCNKSSCIILQSEKVFTNLFY